MPTTPDQELRIMVGDLYMQLAITRTELINLKEQMGFVQPTQPNGLDQNPPQPTQPPQPEDAKPARTAKPN